MTTECKSQKTYNFDAVLQPEVSQQEVFEESVKPIVEHVLGGKWWSTDPFTSSLRSEPSYLLGEHIFWVSSLGLSGSAVFCVISVTLFLLKTLGILNGIRMMIQQYPATFPLYYQDKKFFRQ